MNDSHIYCRLYGALYRLRIAGIDFSKKPTKYTVDSSDLLRMMPRIIVGAAYDTYTPFKVIKAGRADFKIKLIERVAPDEWRYTFVDVNGRPFETYLKRRQYAIRHCESVSAKRQSTQFL